MKKLLCTLTLLFFTIGVVEAQSILISGGTPAENIAGDGSNIPKISDDTDFGSVDIASGFAAHTFTITNNIASNLTIGLDNLSNSIDFSQTTPPSPETISGGLSSTFSITFDPVTVGAKNSIVTIIVFNEDTFDEETFTFNVGGTGIVAASEPIIRVFGGLALDQEIFDASSASPTNGTDFGDVETSSSKTNTFRILNDGNADLIIDAFGSPGSSDFTNPDEPLGANITITPGNFYDFQVIYTPSGEFAASATIFIGHNDNTPASLEPFSFGVIGNGVAPVPIEPIIRVFGGLALDQEIFDASSANTINGTDFGDVETSSSKTNTFRILNDGNADLIVDSFGSPGSSDFTNPDEPLGTPITITPGNFYDFQVNYAPSGEFAASATIFIGHNDDTPASLEPFSFGVIGNGIAPAAEMDVFGLGNPIDDGSTSTSPANDTDFGTVDISTGSVTHIFTITNNGTLDLDLTDPSPYVLIGGVDAADFNLVAIPSGTITPTNSTTFSITFDPTGTALTTRTAIVSIANNDLNEDPYDFVISGTAIDANVDSPLMITQYYEGAGNDQWIEVKNISLNNIVSGFYNLALYTNTSTRDGQININPPQQSIGISGTGPSGQILPGEVIVFKNSSAVLPLSGNLGSALVVPTTVCTFTGNDIILISESVGANCYNDRIDIVGVVAPSDGFPPDWGVDKSLIKGCGTNIQPSLVFDQSDFIELLLEEVDLAFSDTNAAIGTQRIGTTTWSGSSWSNGTSDRTRNAIINGTYTAANGSFGACDLSVLGNLNFDSNTSNYVEVSKNLDISGSFTIGDQESLYSVFVLDPGGFPVSISGTITKKETTTLLNDSDDYTYWSSPVESINMSTVFAPGTYQQTRLFYWDQSVANIIPGGGSEALGEWISAANLNMIQGKGYISQSPETGTYPMTNGATVQFSGTPTNGTIDLIGGNDVVFNNNANPEDDLNLMGNPYPSAIDANAFINDGNNAASINGTLWFWTHTTPNNQSGSNEYTADDYASYNLTGGTVAISGGALPGRYVGSGQGFMVQTNSTIERITFTDGMRVKGLNTQFFREPDTKNTSTEEEDRIWLNMESSEGGAFSQILVGFMENATDGFDRAYDGTKISAGWVNFYSKIDTLKYGIQGLSSFDIDKIVPMGFDTFIDDTAVSYKISIDHLEGALNDNEVYIVDNELNVTHDLKQADYKFSTAGEGNYPDRFTLQFTKSTLDVDDLVLNNDFVIVNEENALLVKSNTVIDQIKVYDITGRLLIDQKPKENEFRISTHNIRKGTVLILNTTFENGAEISKKAIKY